LTTKISESDRAATENVEMKGPQHEDDWWSRFWK